MTLWETGLTFKWLAEFEADTKPCDDANGGFHRPNQTQVIACPFVAGQFSRSFRCFSRRNSHFCHCFCSGNVAEILSFDARIVELHFNLFIYIKIMN